MEKELLAYLKFAIFKIKGYKTKHKVEFKRALSKFAFNLNCSSFGVVEKLLYIPIYTHTIPLHTSFFFSSSRKILLLHIFSKMIGNDDDEGEKCECSLCWKL